MIYFSVNQSKSNLNLLNSFKSTADFLIYRIRYSKLETDADVTLSEESCTCSLVIWVSDCYSLTGYFYNGRLSFSYGGALSKNQLYFGCVPYSGLLSTVLFFHARRNVEKLDDEDGDTVSGHEA